jgi:hypothetical protein
MASTSRHLSDESVFDILHDSDECLISDSSEDSDTDSDNCEDDIAVADAALDEDSQAEEDGDTDFSSDFLWEDMENYNGQRVFFSANSGPQNSAVNVQDILSVFLLFFSRDIVHKIVLETNRYAEQFINSRGRLFPFRSPARQWRPVTESEIYVMLGLFLLMGIIQKPTLRSYFSRKRILSTPGFGDVISRDRFELIMKFLHFSDNTNKGNYEGPAKLYKIYSVLSHLNNKFQNLYLPGQNISVDESLTLWKGRLSFKQYIPLKAAKFGIKTYELCEANSGYLWSLVVYTGRDTHFQSSLVTQEMNKTTAIVLHLVEPLLGKGHTVWLDNFYNSPALARLLKDKGTDCVGTLKINRKAVPKKVKDAKLNRGEIIAQHSGPVTVMKWRDKRNVVMISTYHDAEMQSVTKRGKETKKPVCVIHYNKWMGGIDLKDQLLQTYLVERKRLHKWYMKLFRRLLNATVLNAMIIYRHNTGQQIDQLAFRVNLVEALFHQFADTERKVPGRKAGDNTIPRLRERHFIHKVPPGKKSAPQRRCVVCTKHGRRKETRYCCLQCDVGLCLEKCFEAYHTKLNF